MTPTPSSANNPASNSLAESAVKSAKILLRKSIEEKSNYAEVLCHFNITPREDGYSPSELFHGKKLRTYLPTLDNSVDVSKGKASRELTDMITRNTSQTHKPLKALEKGDLCYRRELDRKKMVKINDLCEVIEVRKWGESYYIKDLESERTYLRNRSWIEPCNEALNKKHKAIHESPSEKWFHLNHSI